MEEIEAYIDIAKKCASQTNIILVTNVKGITSEFEDYSSHSVITEYLSILELEEMVNGLKEFGFQTKVYHDESDFIQDVVASNCLLIKTNNLVINLAQKGKKIGRKSLIPSFCDLYNIQYVNSNPYVVSLCRNKYHSSNILSFHSLPTPRSWLYNPNTGWINDMIPPENCKVILKLNSESASIGLDKNNIIHFSLSNENLMEIMSDKYKQEVIVQEFIEGYEVEVPIICGIEPICLTPVGIKISQQILMGDEILTYEIRGKDKYSFYDYSIHYPEVTQKIIQNTKKVATLLGIKGFGRIDYRIDKNGDFFTTDIATSPHIIKHSSYNYSFNEMGYSYSHMLASLIGMTLSK